LLVNYNLRKRPQQLFVDGREQAVVLNQCSFQVQTIGFSDSCGLSVKVG
jgi:hypothetical protein